jgi:hypothetical protein
MRSHVDTQAVLHGLFRAGLPWVLVALLMLANLILSQSSAVLN